MFCFLHIKWSCSQTVLLGVKPLGPSYLLLHLPRIPSGSELLKRSVLWVRNRTNFHYFLKNILLSSLHTQMNSPPERVSKCVVKWSAHAEGCTGRPPPPSFCPPSGSLSWVQQRYLYIRKYTALSSPFKPHLTALSLFSFTTAWVPLRDPRLCPSVCFICCRAELQHAGALEVL